jgi:hypothetical protein
MQPQAMRGQQETATVRLNSTDVSAIHTGL